jgi:hypothetical protein
MNTQAQDPQENPQDMFRESALQTLAIEVDQALRIGPVAHIKHRAFLNGQHGLGCLESHLLGMKEGQYYSLHDWGNYGDIEATSVVIPDAPRGFVIALKKDSIEENESRGSQTTSIPKEAKTENYSGDYIKIDWVYPSKEVMGLGITRNYFFAVERGAKKAGFPSLHIDATNNGLSYWARKEFGLKIPEEKHAGLVEAYRRFLVDKEELIQKACKVSPYVTPYDGKQLPEEIDPGKPYTIPRVFMDFLGMVFLVQGGHLHFYKKFE